MLFIRQSGGVAKLSILKPQQAGLLIHEIRKSIFAAGYMLCQRYTCIVARLNNHTLQQVSNGYAGALADEHF